MKKLNVGGASQAAPKKNGADHPHVTVAGTRLEELLRQFLKIAPDAIDLEKKRKALSQDIGAETRPLFFHYYAGRAITSTTLLASVDGRDVPLIVQEKYPKNIVNDELLHAAIGEEKTNANFHYKTEYAINYDVVPEDKQEALAEGIEKLRTDLNLPDGAIVAKQFIVPNAGFHASRMTLLTEEENQKLDKVMTLVAFPKL